MCVCFSVCWFRRRVGCVWCDTAGGFRMPHSRSTKCKWSFHGVINCMTLPHEGTQIVITLWRQPFQVRTREQVSLRCKGFIYISYKIFMNVRIGKSTPFLFNLWIPAFNPPLSNGCCRCAVWRGRVRESCDRMDISWPTEKLAFVSRRI